MLLLGGLDALPVGDHAAERMVALRMHARELAEARGGACTGCLFTLPPDPAESSRS